MELIGKRLSTPGGKIIMAMPLAGILLLLAFGCNSSTDRREVIPEETFVLFYADMLLLSNDTTAAIRDSSIFYRRVDSLYEAYNLDSITVRENVEAYSAEPQRWQAFFDKVITRLEELGRREEVADTIDS